jgi:hypothetical protein
LRRENEKLLKDIAKMNQTLEKSEFDCNNIIATTVTGGLDSIPITVSSQKSDSAEVVNNPILIVRNDAAIMTSPIPAAATSKQTAMSPFTPSKDALKAQIKGASSLFIQSPHKYNLLITNYLQMLPFSIDGALCQLRVPTLRRIVLQRLFRN